MRKYWWVVQIECLMLRQRNAELREALKPFAEAAESAVDLGQCEEIDLQYYDKAYPLATVSVGDLRRAKKAMGGEG